MPASDADHSIYKKINDLLNRDPAMSAGDFVLYDLMLSDQNGLSVTGLSGMLTISIPVPEGMMGDIRVMRYDPDTETLMDMNAVLDGGYMALSINHFSYYAIVQMIEAPDPVTPDSKPGFPYTILLLVLGGIALAGGICFVIWNQRKRKR